MAPTDDRPERKWKIRKHGEEAAFHYDWPTFGPRHRIVGDSAVGSDNERRNGRVSDIAIESACQQPDSEIHYGIFASYVSDGSDRIH